ncbi:uncharacterized protein [Eurosta solidaginis]|uniref:uncharacterized protein n=1 Tax=Eurosta solidaginis TaxID=178769 RepID=UPI0035310057
MTGLSHKRAKTEARGNTFSVPCRLCQKSHSIRLCPIYRGMTNMDRLKTIIDLRYCTNCLSPFHQRKTCPSEDRCHRCNEQHHTSTHLDDVPPPSHESDGEESSDGALSIHVTEQTLWWEADVAEEEVERREDPTSMLATTPPGGSGPQGFRPLLRHERPSNLQRGDGGETRPFPPSHRSAGRRRGDAEPRPSRSSRRSIGRAAPYNARAQVTTLARQPTTLARQPTTPAGFRTGRLRETPLATTITRAFVAIAPTAVVRIAAGGKLHAVRALIDPCAPNSIIDANLAKDLGLERTGTSYHVKCTLVLRGKYGVTGAVTTQATVVSRYSRLTPTATLDPSVATPFQFMKLADPSFHRSTPVRLTLGADVYASLMVSGTPPSNVGGLLTQATIFGLVVSGAHQQ